MKVFELRRASFIHDWDCHESNQTPFETQAYYRTREEAKKHREFAPPRSTFGYYYCIVEHDAEPDGEHRAILRKGVPLS